MSPLLFVLIMEYLTHALKVVAAQKQFHYHPDYKLCSFSFADDLLLFYKDDVDSLKCLLSTLHHFTHVYRMVINPAKSHLVMPSISEQIAKCLLNLLVFKKARYVLTTWEPQLSLRNYPRMSASFWLRRQSAKLRVASEETFLYRQNPTCLHYFAEFY